MNDFEIRVELDALSDRIEALLERVHDLEYELERSKEYAREVNERE